MGARMYDPELGRFISPDTIIPNPANSQSLNRYAYALNNPLRYTDPTGHIEQDEVDEAQDILDELAKYGVSIAIDWGKGLFGKWRTGLWTIAELQLVQSAIRDLANIFDSAAEVTNAIGGVTIKQVERGGNGHIAGRRLIKIADQTLNNSEILGLGPKWAIVHELAHYWDWKAGKELSAGLVAFTGGTVTRRNYDYGGSPPKGANDSFTVFEDFAESVTTFVYPGQAAAHIQTFYADNPRFHYANYYQTPRGMYIATLVNMDWQALQARQAGWDW